MLVGFSVMREILNTKDTTGHEGKRRKIAAKQGAKQNARAQSLKYLGRRSLRWWNRGEEIRGGPAGARVIVGRDQIPPGIAIRLLRAVLDHEGLFLLAEEHRVAGLARLLADAQPRALGAGDLHIGVDADLALRRAACTAGVGATVGLGVAVEGGMMVRSAGTNPSGGA